MIPKLVLAFLLGCAAVAGPAIVLKQEADYFRERDRTIVRNIADSVASHHADSGVWPETLADVAPPACSSRGACALTEVPVDDSGREFRLLRDAKGLRVVCASFRLSDEICAEAR